MWYCTLSAFASFAQGLPLLGDADEMQETGAGALPAGGTAGTGRKMGTSVQDKKALEYDCLTLGDKQRIIIYDIVFDAWGQNKHYNMCV